MPSAFFLLTAIMLLILFLLAMPYTAYKPHVTLPEASIARPIDPGFSTVLAIDGAGTFFLDGRPMDDAQLRKSLQKIAHLSPQPVLRIRADKRLPYETIRTVVGLAHDAGLQDVRFEVTHAH